MQRFRFTEIFIAWLTLLAIAEARAETPLSWPGQMQAIHRSLMELLPLTTSDHLYRDPKRKSEIEAKARRLAELTATLKTLQPPGDEDPSTKILAELFAEYSSRASRELAKGNRSDARILLNDAPAFCVGCHTRTNQGPDFSKLGLEAPAPLIGMTEIENARLLVAARLYGAAEKEYDRILHSIPEEGDSSGQWKTAVYGALTLAVRVRNDADRASEVIEHVLSRGFVPVTLRNDVLRWKRTVEEWKGETKTPFTDDKGLIGEMRRLHDRAKELQIAPKDRGADLVYLRISALGHELLGRYPKSTFAPEALLLLGESYEVMQTWDFWTFHEVIYERCVRQFPGTETAGKCLTRLKGSIRNDYVGEKIPAWQQTRLSDLEKMAHLMQSKRP